MALMMIVAASWVVAGERDLAKRVALQDGWVAWKVPMTLDGGVPCCPEWHGQHAIVAGACDLDGRNWSVNSRESGHAGPADPLIVYMSVAQGVVEKVRAFAASCPVRDAGHVRWLDAVDERDSIALLADAAPHARDEIADIELAALSLHADASATTALSQLSQTGHARHLREQSLFWLAQERGTDGARIVERAAANDSDADLRANAVFDLSQAHGVDAYAAIRRIAQADASEHVREQSLFWMAQMDDARARDDIITAIREDHSDRVREQAVFALSQLKHEQADAALIAVVRGNFPRKAKEQALFWLGQSGSPQALDFMDALLSKPPAHPSSG
jgi:hypothetical protein